MVNAVSRKSGNGLNRFRMEAGMSVARHGMQVPHGAGLSPAAALGGALLLTFAIHHGRTGNRRHADPISATPGICVIPQYAAEPLLWL
jgi:hypothetical protein